MLINWSDGKMAILRPEVSEKGIQNEFLSEEFQEFLYKSITLLNIDDMNLNISIEDSLPTKDSYPSSGSNLARIYFSKDYNSVEKVIISKRDISMTSNIKFGKLSNSAFHTAVIIVMQFALIHELVHALQFKKGKITSSSVKEINEENYEDSEIEKEARLKAYEVVATNAFNKEIIDCFINDTTINNDDANRLLRLYKDLNT